MKRLLLVFGFTLFVVSCGGGGGGSHPSTVSTTNYFVHDAKNSKTYWNQYYIYKELPANINDKITPDERQEMVYAFGGMCPLGSANTQPGCSGEITTFEYGTLPSPGDTVYVSRFLVDADYCQFSLQHQTVAACDVPAHGYGHRLLNWNHSDIWGGLNNYAFLRCEWEVVSWTGVTTDIPLPADAYCDIFRYNQDYTELYWAGYMNDPAVTWFADEQFVFRDSALPGENLYHDAIVTPPTPAFFPFTYPSSVDPFAYRTAWLQQTVQPDLDPDGNPVDTWKIIPSDSLSIYPPDPPGFETASPESCQKIVSVSKEFGPLAPLTTWSYEGAGWLTPWAGVCPETWAGITGYNWHIVDWDTSNDP